MRYLWDSNTCIQHLRNRSPGITRRLLESNEGDVMVCSVVRAELRYGALRHPKPAVELARLHELWALAPSLPLDDPSADHAASIRFDLAARGNPIGPNDVLIAAIARANGLTLVTHNTAEFSRVPGLLIDDWQAQP